MREFIDVLQKWITFSSHRIAQIGVSLNTTLSISMLMVSRANQGSLAPAKETTMWSWLGLVQCRPLTLICRPYSNYKRQVAANVGRMIF